ncbi:MAG: efflux RND transporter periplasmic adaptor subunit, partial [Legionellaceae bacterium]|nr:efflux RND transporter periplasmic adaptor subunit [Legionellaceae bacterium]
MQTLLIKRLTKLLIALSILFGCILGFNLFKSFMIQRFFATYEPPAVYVSSVSALKKEWQPNLYAVGLLKAQRGVEVNAEVPGNVVALHFQSGESVTAGQPLLDLDDSVEQATLAYNAADLALKKLNYNRQLSLLKQQATSTSTVDEAKANLEKSEASVTKIKAQIAQKHISAPFSGRLGIREVNLGQYITPGSTPIVTLQSYDTILVEFYLPEQYLPAIKPGQKFTARFEAYPQWVFEGDITAFNSSIDPNNHNLKIEGKLNNCAMTEVDPRPHSSAQQAPKVIHCTPKPNTSRYAFMPGMYAALEVYKPEKYSVIVLPSTAIDYSLYGNSVFVISKNDKGQLVANRRFITTGAQRDNETIITSGLKAGELVVGSG